MIALLLQGAIWGQRAIVAWIRYSLEARRDDASAATTLSVVGFIAKVVLWSVAVLMVLANLGFNVTGLVAGLGIGGVAVALAVQSIVGDLFASLVIAMDKPFALGDFIVVGDVKGTVDRLGIKTTRIRSVSGEEISMPNGMLLSSSIRNFKRMTERRIEFRFGVLYQTTPGQLERIPVIVREIIGTRPDARFDRAHFLSYGDSSLDFEVVYYVLSPDHNCYMDVQHAINVGIFRRFAEAGIEFAYPTRTLYMAKTPAREEAAS
jgi:small-conductance mechanosensitive channel